MQYQVAGFVIDTTQFRITSSGTVIPTEPKVFDLIVCLIKNRQRLISREELFDRVWAGREVSDTSLSNHIKSARKILGDNGDLQKIIKTIRGRGYQFIAEVIEAPLDDGENSSGLMGDVALAADFNLKHRTTSGTHLTFKILAAITVCLGIAAFIGWQLESPSSTLQVADTRPYILVVPFGVSGDAQGEWEAFADQISREVISDLRKISGLRVVPPPSAFTFKSNKIRSYIRAQLPEVRYVLDGVVSIGQQGQIRITPELEDLQNGELVWNGDYQSRIDDTNFFSVQAEIAASVSESLQIVILEDEQRALGELPTINLAAYEAYAEGQQQLNRSTHESLRRSIELFSVAIGLDPEFDLAYIAKADAYRIIMSNFANPIDILPNVIDSVVEALAIKPDSSEARSSLGLAYVLAWRWEDAWNMLNEARESNPNLALTELGFALYYSGLGDVEGVHRSLARANQLDPLNIELANWGQWALTMTGELEAAVSWSAEKILLHPEIGIIYSGASVAVSLLGDHEEAIELARNGALFNTRTPASLYILAQAFGRSGQLDKINPLLNEAAGHEGYKCPYEAAVTTILKDDINRVFELLNDAVEIRSNCLIFTRNDPRLESLRNDPRFTALLARIGLDVESIRRYSR